MAAQPRRTRLRSLRRRSARHLEWLIKSSDGAPWHAELVVMAPMVLAAESADAVGLAWRRLLVLYRSLPQAAQDQFYRRFDRLLLRLQAIERVLTSREEESLEHYNDSWRAM